MTCCIIYAETAKPNKAHLIRMRSACSLNYSRDKSGFFIKSGCTKVESPTDAFEHPEVMAATSTAVCFRCNDTQRMRITVLGNGPTTFQKVAVSPPSHVKPLLSVPMLLFAEASSTVVPNPSSIGQ